MRPLQGRLIKTIGVNPYPIICAPFRGKHCANAAYFDTNFEHSTLQGFASCSVALGYVASVSKSPYIIRAPAGDKSLAKNNLRDFYHVFLGDATLLILF